MFKSREEFVAFVNDFNVLTQEHIDQAVQLKWLKQELQARMSHACISPEYVTRLEQRVRDLEGWPEIACQQSLDRQVERMKTAKRMRALRAEVLEARKYIAFVDAAYLRLAK